jgi:cytochrome P450
VNFYKDKQEIDDIGAKRSNLAFLDLLLMAQNDGAHFMNDEDIRDEVSTFMFEGHDTVTTAISWTLFMLGNHQDVQQKVFDELDAVFGTSDRAPSMNDLAELKYLERCIKETLRLYPSVPFFERQITEDALLECNSNTHSERIKYELLMGEFKAKCSYAYWNKLNR